jgi:phage-related tail protein
MRRRQIDPRARRLALALGASRVALGAGALFFTRPTLKALLFGETDGVGRALAKLAGGRDLALGLLTLAARDDRETLRAIVLSSAVLDAADAFALGLAARDGETRLAGLGGVASGATGAAAGAWAWRRLGG